MILISVCGARPNFMKTAPIAHEINQRPDCGIEHLIVHTGQHYDKNMSDTFFTELDIPEPDVNLEAGSGTHAVQTARIMESFETWLLSKGFQDQKELYVMLVGDVNSTLACSVTAKKLHLNVIHYEAGIRSFDRGMPEEINRIVTDSIADICFVTEQSGLDNLLREGHSASDIHLVGNLMIDTLMANKEKAEQKDTYRTHGLTRNEYGLLTMHRPSNVDDPDTLAEYIDAFEKITSIIPIICPLHPRSEKNLKQFGLWDRISSIQNMILTPPAGYLDMLNLQANCRFVITDSGGIQDESTALMKPCITLRPTTERPITVEQGTSVLTGTDTAQLLEYVEMIKNNKYKKSSPVPLWDGKTAKRIINILEKL